MSETVQIQDELGKKEERDSPGRGKGLSQARRHEPFPPAGRPASQVL